MISIILMILGELPPGTIVIPGNKFDTEIDINIEVIQDTFFYQYTVKNLSTSEQKLWLIQAILPKSEDTVYIPEKGSNNSHWKVRFLKGKGHFGALYCTTVDSLQDIFPNDSIIIWYKVYGSLLPDVSDLYIEGDAPPPTFPDEPPENWEEVYGIKYYSLTPYGPGKVYKIAGPGAYPPGYWYYDSYYVTSEGFSHLIDRVNKCYELGWINRVQVRNHLNNLLERAKKDYEAGRFRQMRQVLDQAIEYIQGKRGSSINDNAFYILYYRTIFVKEHLEYPG